MLVTHLVNMTTLSTMPSTLIESHSDSLVRNMHMRHTHCWIHALLHPCSALVA